MGAKKISRMGMLVAAAFVLSYVESILPISFGIPGIKVGLSNIVVVISLYEMNAGEAFGIAMTVLKTSALLYYFLVLLVAGCATGIAVGIVSAMLQMRLHGQFVEG